VARVCLAVAIATAHSLVMADPVQTLTDARDSAIAALDVADYTAARKAAVKALAVLATVPDGQTQAGGHTWNRGAIEDFIAQVDRLERLATASGDDDIVMGIETAQSEYVGYR